MLDKDMVGNTVSPETGDNAPPRVSLTRIGIRPGGAALAAELIRAEGLDVILATVLAGDDNGNLLMEHVNSEISILPIGSRGQTKCVTRVMTRNGRTLARMDTGLNGFSRISLDSERELAAQSRRCDVILISDYGGGISSHPHVRSIVERKAKACPVIWDPHLLGGRPVSGIEIMTPNRREAVALARITGGLGKAIEEIHKTFSIRSIVCTDGARGVLAMADDGAVWAVAAPAVGAVDACGAGDRLVASLVASSLLKSNLRTDLSRAILSTAEWLAAGGVAPHTVWRET
jgi:bifunctional ADP-heptose synthase (sugar kinase/adenylyltransferase)